MNISATNNTYSAVKPLADPLITFTVPATMFAAGVIGNILATVVLARSSREHKRRVFYRLVGALACTDLLGTCATSPVTLAVYANNFKWVGGMPLCNYESFMLIFASCSTILIICTMAVDRFVSICHPFVYDKHVTIGKTKYALMALWSFAFVMGCLPIIGLGENIVQFPGTWCFFTFTSSVIKNKMYAYFYAIIGILGIVVTAISNLFVISVLIKMRCAAVAMAPCHACSHRQSREIQMMILMIGIVVIFSTCWCPFLVRIIINQIHHKHVNVKADLMTLRLASLNQILDPWIYILFRKEMFAKGMKLVRNVMERFCKKVYRKQSACSLKNGITSTTATIVENETTADSLANNFDENDMFLSELSTTSTSRASTKTSRKSKSDRKERPSLQKLMSQHNPQCAFGLKHPSSLFCFTHLPQAFALSLGTAQVVTTELAATEENNLPSEPE
ncbi:prostaglandin E2 receptor EP4 subtype-like [Mercenaria mercenaria]|uniref:prostaglandin E2 receptor EP4 subtype-like n=1 Tax=Mercenaria mercenaria TaxID=6596 RepID=UPI00234EF7E8|nr:prostaglandin E2 receptor EP4 subtype-like [Mercenaria mercenaria]